MPKYIFKYSILTETFLPAPRCPIFFYGIADHSTIGIMKEITSALDLYFLNVVEHFSWLSFNGSVPELGAASVLHQGFLPFHCKGRTQQLCSFSTVEVLSAIDGSGYLISISVFFRRRTYTVNLLVYIGGGNHQ